LRTSVKTGVEKRNITYPFPLEAKVALVRCKAVRILLGSTRKKKSMDQRDGPAFLPFALPLPLPLLSEALPASETGDTERPASEGGLWP